MPESPLVVPGQVLRRPHSPCQRPQHEERKLRRRFGENVGRMGERDLVAVGIGAIDVVEAHRDLGHNLQRSLPCLEHLRIDLVAQRGNQSIDARSDFIEDDRFRRRFRMGIYLDVVSAAAQNVNRLSDIAGGEDTKLLVHVG